MEKVEFTPLTELNDDLRTYYLTYSDLQIFSDERDFTFPGAGAHISLLDLLTSSNESINEQRLVISIGFNNLNNLFIEQLYLLSIFFQDTDTEIYVLYSTKNNELIAYCVATLQIFVSNGDCLDLLSLISENKSTQEIFNLLFQNFSNVHYNIQDNVITVHQRSRKNSLN